MVDVRLNERSRVLSDRVDALAAALSEAGVSAETASRVLASAATATLHALTLELLLDGRAPAVEAPAAPVEPDGAAPAVRLAA